MEGLIRTLALTAVAAAAFPVAFLGVRMCLRMVVRWLPAKEPSAARDMRG
jgi:hypothetical protein